MERYEIVVSHDRDTCPVCGKLDGKVFDKKDYMPGTTANPFHPNCRCTTAPYSEDMKGIGERFSRNVETGEAEMLPADMTYEEWKKRQEKRMASGVESTPIQWDKRGEPISKEQYRELRDLAKENGVVLNGFKNSDVDVDLAKEVITDAGDLMKRYPELRGTEKKPFTLMLDPLRPDDFASTDPGITHIIHLNEDAFRNKKKIAEEYEKSAVTGWFVRGTDYRSVLYHEAGHLLTDIRKINCNSVLSKITANVPTENRMAFLREKVSEYAALDPFGNELIAEAFSAYYSGRDDEIFLTILKECGIL